ncbi:MAG: glycosyltransferase, partial [Proteobacteria bacterium]|nr:glycosyltransferase [Pseudomonadota bacterium]
HDRQTGSLPVLVWNHRWEHDKNPELFFETLYALSEQGVSFGLIVLGESFKSRPKVFAQAQERLADRIVHFGYAEDYREYCRLLCQGDIVVSTANHEFYGMAVLEAVRSGCRPVVPDRLSYRELFAPAFRYEDAGFARQLRSALGAERLKQHEAHTLTGRFSWPELAGSYRQWFEEENA